MQISLCYRTMIKWLAWLPSTQSMCICPKLSVQHRYSHRPWISLWESFEKPSSNGIIWAGLFLQNLVDLVGPLGHLEVSNILLEASLMRTGCSGPCLVFFWICHFSVQPASSQEKHFLHWVAIPCHSLCLSLPVFLLCTHKRNLSLSPLQPLTRNQELAVNILFSFFFSRLDKLISLRLISSHTFQSSWWLQLDSLQYVSVFLVLGNPRLDLVQQMWVVS